MKPAVLMLNVLNDAHRAKIEEHYTVIYAPTPAERAEAIATRAQEIQAVMTIGTVGLTAAEIDALPKLSLVCTLGVGYERVDTEHARARGIALANGAGTNADVVADQAFALLLATVRQVPANDRSARQGVDRDHLPMLPQLAYKRMGILGLGAIGNKIAQRARGFDMEVGYHSRTQRSDCPHRYFASLAELAAWCDVLVVAAPGGKETHHAVDAGVLRAIGRAGYLVNISRGSVVDTEALAAALAAGDIAGAGLDVYESEPLPPQPLIGFSQLVLSPHIGGRSPEAVNNTVERFLANAGGHFSGKGVVSAI
ncbi:2-hydroxyacid dehydrogenase [Xylophilus rhododendri]|uniref:2-hydroxyacid dehydrogenase n=1 Tax=Xylophilus rhododendri TaxID=2697032 RepID=A0A857J4Y1_9BURK|nr:NAD(P)-dependent oxidoreductase [Xylophilus rhododendri]QHI97905.1 2-hydroxyacid dehydrogenase [Xylophilus rhododendri]